MSTISGLLLNYPQMRPYDDASATINAINAAGGITRGQTALLELADLKRQQETAAAQRQYYQQHPGALLGEQPLSTLGSLQTASAPGGAPAPGPITQQAFGPGGVTGPPQQIPAPMQPNANLGGMPGGAPMPPPSTLGSLGGPPQAPRNPLLDLARQNPDAALAVVDRQQKMAEQQLTWKSKVAGYMGSVLQGVNSQESYDQARQEIARISPEWAQALPATYSKEALEPFIARALSVKDKATLDATNLQTQVDAMKARLSAELVPKYTGDSALNVAIAQEMQRRHLPLASMPPQDVLDAAQKRIQQGKLDVSAAQSENAARIQAQVERTEKPLEGEAAKAVSDLTTLRQLTDDVAALRHNDYTGPVVGRTGYLREQAGAMGQQETAFRRTVKDMTDILARLRSGAALPPAEMARLESLVPSVNDPPETFQAKLQSFQRAIEQQRASRLQTATTPRSQLREQMAPTTTQPGGPTSQAPAGKPAPVAFDAADFQRWRGNKPGQPTATEVEEYFKSKGLRRAS